MTTSLIIGIVLLNVLLGLLSRSLHIVHAEQRLVVARPGTYSGSPRSSSCIRAMPFSSDRLIRIGASWHSAP